MTRAALLLAVAWLASPALQASRAQPSARAGHAVAIQVDEVNRIAVGGNIEFNIDSGQIGQWVNGDNADGRSTADLHVITNVTLGYSRKVTVSAARASGESLQTLGLRVDAQFLPAGSSQLYSEKRVLTDLGSGLPGGAQDLIGDLSSLDTRAGNGPYLNYDGRVNAEYDPSVSTVIEVEYTLTEQ